jgi:hypothetical protein
LIGSLRTASAADLAYFLTHNYSGVKEELVVSSKLDSADASSTVRLTISSVEAILRHLAFSLVVGVIFGS